MLIRKLFTFENAHIVRNCSSDRCKNSIHGHSYKIELLLKANQLDNGQMVYDFGLLKGHIKQIIDSFDHAIAFWCQDDPDYIATCKKFSARWVSMPVSPSAEQFSRVIFFWVDQLLKQTLMQNGEKDVCVYSVIVHETSTGYAQCFYEDVVNEQMGILSLKDFEFSQQIKDEWEDPLMYEKLINNYQFINPKVQLQVNPLR